MSEENHDLALYNGGYNGGASYLFIVFVADDAYNYYRENQFQFKKEFGRREEINQISFRTNFFSFSARVKHQMSKGTI
jgi:hypothetical protein